jgi:hypothetical protein
MEHALKDKSTHVDVASGLFKLPRELRDMIYNYVWNDTGAIRQHYKGRVYKVSYRRPFWETAQHLFARRGNAQWLLINKQVMYEGLLQLLREATWHINSTDYSRFLRRTETFKTSRMTADFLPKLAPADTRVVHLDARDSGNGLQWIFGYNFRRNKFRDYGGHIATILDGNTPESRLETIVLRLGVSPVNTKHCSGVGPVSFDLSALDQLSGCSQLKKFRVHVRISAFLPSSVDPLFLYIDGMEQYMQGLAKALSAVGKLIIEGGQETTTSLDEYYAEISEVYGRRCGMRESFWRYTIERS